MSKDKTPNNMGDFDAINEVVDEVTAENSLHNEGRIIQVELDDEMRKSFLEYSMSVIVGPCPARCTGRIEAGSPPHSVCRR